jgi:hypothetical protein
MSLSFLEALSWIFSSDDGLVSPGENSSFGQPEWVTTASTSHPSCGRRLGESALAVVCGFSCWGHWTSGQRPRMVVVRRGGGLGSHGGQMLHEAKQLLAWLG